MLYPDSLSFSSTKVKKKVIGLSMRKFDYFKINDLPDSFRFEDKLTVISKPSNYLGAIPHNFSHNECCCTEIDCNRCNSMNNRYSPFPWSSINYKNLKEKENSEFYPDELHVSEPNTSITNEDIFLINEKVFPFEEITIDDTDDLSLFSPTVTNIPNMQDGTGEPKTVPASAFQSIRTWVKNFFGNAPRIQNSISWKEPDSSNNWDPVTLNIGDDVSIQHMAWKEFIYYFWVIEELYKYYGLIKSNQSYLRLNRSPPVTLELPRSITKVNGRDINSTYARRYFLAYLAHSFVLERYRLVPWSLVDYTYSKENNAQYLLNSETFLPLKLESGIGYRFDVEVSPSDPTILFLWMVRQGWIPLNNSRRSQLDNSKREEIRDNIIRWCGSFVKHAGGGRTSARPNSGFPKLRRKDGVAYRPPDYWYQLYYGNYRYPSLLSIVAGHCISYQSVVVTDSNGSITTLEDPPSPMVRLAGSKPITSFFMRARRGCWAANELFIYLFRIINIPSYGLQSTVAPGHASLVMPAEPNPHNPKVWLAPHTDLLLDSFVNLPNPLNPAPMKDIFWVWSDFVKTMNDPSLHPTDPLMSTKFKRGDYADKFWGLIDKRRKELAKQYPTLQDIVAAIEKLGLLAEYRDGTLQNNKLTPDYLYKGPYTGWSYSSSELQNGLAWATTFPNNISNYFRITPILEQAKQFIQVRSSKSSTQYANEARLFWSLYDLAFYKRFIPQSYSMPILKRNFTRACY